MYEYLFIVQAKLKADRWHRENRRLGAHAPVPDPGDGRSRPDVPRASSLSEYTQPRTQS